MIIGGEHEERDVAAVRHGGSLARYPVEPGHPGDVGVVGVALIDAAVPPNRLAALSGWTDRVSGMLASITYLANSEQ